MRSTAAVLILSLASFNLPAEPQPAVADPVAGGKPVLMSQHERTIHLLDRLTFGPRPGDVERVERMGLHTWIDQQLHPELIDDSDLERRLDRLPAMRMSTVDLLRRFPPNATIRMVENGRMTMPPDPVERAIYQNKLANSNNQRQQRETKQAADIPQADTIESQRLLAMPPEQRWTAILQEEPGRLRPIVQKMKPADRLALFSGFSVEQREDLTAMVNVNRAVAGELMQETVLRAIYSRRELNEVMTDFWLNHFNVYVKKNGEMPWLLATYERDVIRPHAMGKFEDLLRAVAHSPAMLVYLDNQQSIGPQSQAALNISRNRAQKNGPPGLNENYARELMELHTLGVKGGYTQQDVTEVAKVLTGWGVEPPRDAYGFKFYAKRHEPGTKKVLGKTIAENGELEGDEVLHLLATRPATAKFIATKLAMRFVSDDPPPALVNRMAKKFLKTKGDIREVLREMANSPEFWSPDAYRAKVKTPFDYVVSAVRATNADVQDATPLVRSLERLGMPLYGAQQPNGYSLNANAWLGTEALLARMDFAMALTTNRFPGVTLCLPMLGGDDETRERRLEEQMLNGVVAERTHTTVLQQMEMAQATAGRFVQGHRNVDFEAASQTKQDAPRDPKAAMAAALLLGSPDFQRR